MISSRDFEQYNSDMVELTGNLVDNNVGILLAVAYISPKLGSGARTASHVSLVTHHF
jgi:hypothetical protein